MMQQRKAQLEELQARIGYSFRDISLLDAALTHTSFVKGDGKGSVHNERLEYLGDAVLELCISEQLFLRYPTWNEGSMTRVRAMIVCESALDQAGRKHFGLQEFLLLGLGEENTGGRTKPSILSDALEALIGAIYLDGGLEYSREFILKFAQEALKNATEKGSSRDYKTALQEYVQKKRLGSIKYDVVSETGPDHKKQFIIAVSLNEALVGEGSGNSKQEAGQHAARAALKALRGKKAK
ncbi:MAG TPA: ribonuclease III [Clostridia bacterium]|nr:ribonuclease III [Clostridia bacterium]